MRRARNLSPDHGWAVMSSMLHHTLPLRCNRTELEHFASRFAQVERGRYDIPIAPGAGARDILHEILCEIDETMLPRQLCLVCRPGGTVSLIISNRRLLAVGKEGHFQEPPQTMPKAVARHFASVLRSAIEGAREVTLMAPRPLAAHDSADLSVSAALLGDALGLRDYDAPAGGDVFGAACAAASAWVEATPDLRFSNERGAGDDVGMLKEFWEDYAGQLAEMSQGQRIQTLSTQCVMLPLGPDQCLLLITEDEDRWGLALVPRDRVQDFVDAWPSLCLGV